LDSNEDSRANQVVDESYPHLIRLNIGLAHANADGSYRYGCPSRWGGYEMAQFAVSSNGLELVSLGGGVVRASSDGGCTFDEVEMPAELGYPRDVGWVQSRFYVLGGDENSGALVSFGSDWLVRIETIFPGDADALGFAPDTLVLQAGAPGVVVVAGARPTPQVWQASLPATGLPSEGWSASSSSLGGDWSYLSVRHIEEDGTAWLVASTTEGRILVRVRSDPELAENDEWLPSTEVFENLMGPVELGANLVLIADGKSALVQDDGSAFSIQQGTTVDWTCLQAVGAYVYVCQLNGVLRLNGPFDVVRSDDTPLFSMKQLGGPGSTCASTDEESVACDLDWYHYGGEAGLLDQTPWTGPTGPGGDSGGCKRGPRGSIPWALLVVLFLMVSVRSRNISLRGHQYH